MKKVLTAVTLVLLGCSNHFETLEVEMSAIPENAADPKWRTVFQRAADARCNGIAVIENVPLVFSAGLAVQPPTMSGRFKCK